MGPEIGGYGNRYQWRALSPGCYLPCSTFPRFCRERSFERVANRQGLLPTAAESLVKLNDTVEFVQPDLRERQLSLKQVSIGIQRV